MVWLFQTYSKHYLLFHLGFLCDIRHTSKTWMPDLDGNQMKTIHILSSICIKFFWNEGTISIKPPKNADTQAAIKSYNKERKTVASVFVLLFVVMQSESELCLFSCQMHFFFFSFFFFSAFYLYFLLSFYALYFST